MILVCDDIIVLDANGPFPFKLDLNKAQLALEFKKEIEAWVFKQDVEAVARGRF